MFWVYRYKGFSFTAARTVHTALVLAGQQGCSQADTGHLLLALVQTAQGTAADFLRRKRVTSTALAEHNAAHAAGRPRRLHSRDLAPELSKAMEFAVLGAHAASAARAENEHLLCAILEDSSCTASRWLAALGIELPQAARECRQLSGQLVLPAQPRMAASRTGRPSDKYGRDLTRLAQEGRLDPVLCRDAELIQHVERNAAALCNQAVEHVLTADVIVAKFLRLFDGAVHGIVCFLCKTCESIHINSRPFDHCRIAVLFTDFLLLKRFEGFAHLVCAENVSLPRRKVAAVCGCHGGRLYRYGQCVNIFKRYTA